MSDTQGQKNAWDALRAENERWLGALREIAKWACNTWSGQIQRHDCGRCPSCIARAALEKKS